MTLSPRDIIRIRKGDCFEIRHHFYKECKSLTVRVLVEKSRSGRFWVMRDIDEDKVLAYLPIDQYRSIGSILKHPAFYRECDYAEIYKEDGSYHDYRSEWWVLSDFFSPPENPYPKRIRGFGWTSNVLRARRLKRLNLPSWL